MRSTTGTAPLARLVVVAVLDGLRPDAIDAFDLQNLQHLRRIGASTMTAQTVQPSATWAVMTSLLTGVAPATHGIHGNFMRLPRSKKEGIEPIGEVLGKNGVIHFARWMRLPGTDQLLFFSNYDGSWESYLEDFITRAHQGQSAAWSHGVGFPATRFLISC